MKRKKIIISSLVIWTFLHIVLFVFGRVSNEGEYSETFYPIYHGRIGDLNWYDIVISKYEVYDITEFLIYVGSVWVLYFVYWYIRKK